MSFWREECKVEKRETRDIPTSGKERKQKEERVEEMRNKNKALVSGKEKEKEKEAMKGEYKERG